MVTMKRTSGLLRAPVEGYRKTGQRLVAYARATGIFDVPSEYQLDVTVTPPPLRSGLDGAAYYPAPPFKKTGVGRFYVTPTDNDQALLRREHNKAAMPDLAAHEGFPGHDWHYKVMTQYLDDISPLRWLTPGAVEDSSSMWQDSMAAEGWALYCEWLAKQAGWYEKDPFGDLGRLRDELFRAVRLVVDTGIHAKHWTREQAITYMRDKTGMGDKEVKSEIERYIVAPGQACAYKVGMLKIQELRSRAHQELGDKFDQREFHEAVLKNGAMPLEILEEQINDYIQKKKS